MIYNTTVHAISIDHIDNNRKLDNYICCNLREFTRSEQNKNRQNSTYRRGKMVCKLDKVDTVILVYLSATLAAKDLDVTNDMITSLCLSGKEFKGNRYRYFNKFDFSGQLWSSTKSIHPEIVPPLEFSDGGWIILPSGKFTLGSKRPNYYVIKFFDREEQKYVSRYVHDLTWKVNHNTLIPDNREISHYNTNGYDNRIKNLNLIDHSGNIMNTINQGKHKNCIPVRRIAHNETYIDFVSIAEAIRKTSKCSRADIMYSLNTETSAGLCSCGKLYSWECI